MSFPGRDGSCPGNSILNPAGCDELSGQGWLLPRKLYPQSGRVREAFHAGNAHTGNTHAVQAPECTRDCPTVDFNATMKQ